MRRVIIMPLQASVLFLEIFFFCLTGVQCEPSVTYVRSSICGFNGASVVLPCRFEYKLIGHYVKGEWYEEHSGIVRTYTYNYPDCSLNIDKFSHTLSGVYQFRFHTSLHLSWITGTSGVSLSVTDLQVKVDVISGNQNQIKETCSSTSCSLDSHLHYVWYKDGQTLRGKTTASIILDSTRPSEKGDYSCAVRGHEAQRSPAVCVPKNQCWGVTYSSTSICALMNSSVDIPCTCKYPQVHRINTAFWFNKQKSHPQPEDVSLDKEYKNHVQYLGNKGNNCTLRLKDIRERHSGEYAFSFTTQQGEGYTGLPGVTIIVTTLQVLITPTSVKVRDKVTLTCATTCSLSNDPTFIWYKNEQPVTYNHSTGDKLHLNPVSREDAGNYSCAVRGHESLPSKAVFLNIKYLQVWAPLDTVKEGDKVTLTCNTTSTLSNNSTFTWYKNGQLVTYEHTNRDNKLHLNPVSSEDAGSYSCAVESESLSSTAVFLNVKYSPRNVSLSISPGGIEAGSPVTLTCSSDANPPVHTYTWYMKSGTEALMRDTGESISFSVTSDTIGLYYCEAQNEVGSTNSDAVTVEGEQAADLMVQAGIILFVILTITLLLGALWLRIKKKNNLSSSPHTLEAVYANFMLSTMTSDPEQRGDSHGNEDDVVYASIQFQPPTKKRKSLHSNDKRAQQLKQDEDVVYASIQPSKLNTATW